MRLITIKQQVLLQSDNTARLYLLWNSGDMARTRTTWHQIEGGAYHYIPSDMGPGTGAHIPRDTKPRGSTYH